MPIISSAFATDVATTAAGIPPEPSFLAGAMPLLLILVVFYFLLIRPQQKKYKEHLALVTGIAKGDTIVTSGGVIGKVTKVDDEKDVLHVEIADGVDIRVVRSTVSNVVDNSGKPVARKAAPVKKDVAAVKTAAPKKTAAAKKPSKTA